MDRSKANESGAVEAAANDQIYFYKGSKNQVEDVDLLKFYYEVEEKSGGKSVVHSNTFLKIPMIVAGYAAFFQPRPRAANI